MVKCGVICPVTVSDPGGGGTYGILTFSHHHEALKADAALSKAGFRVRLIPTPRRLTSDCGYALRFAWGERQALEGALSREGIPYMEIHRLEWREK